jgi:hypothetical protein
MARCRRGNATTVMMRRGRAEGHVRYCLDPRRQRIGRGRSADSGPRSHRYPRHEDRNSPDGPATAGEQSLLPGPRASRIDSQHERRDDCRFFGQFLLGGGAGRGLEQACHRLLDVQGTGSLA